MKKLASILTALVMAASMSITAFAVDYATDPKYGVATTEIAVAGSTIGASAAQPASVVTDGYMTEALKAATVAPIYVSDAKAIVTKDTIAAIKAANKPVTFVAPDCSISIDPAKITAVKADLDLSMTITASAAQKTVSSVTIPGNSIIIAPAAKGEFGAELAITISKGSLNGIDLSKAKIYYIADDGTVKDLGALVVAANGSVTITISHASQYVLSATPIAAAAVTTAATAAAITTASTVAAVNPKTGSAQTAPMLALVALLGLSSIAVVVKAKKAKTK